jgi:hypothetical protein
VGILPVNRGLRDWLHASRRCDNECAIEDGQLLWLRERRAPNRWFQRASTSRVPDENECVES